MSKSKCVYFSLSCSSFFALCSLKELALKQNGQRTRLKNNNAEMNRLIQEIQDFGKVIVSGNQVRLDDWLVSGKRARRAEVTATQGSDGLSQSQSSSASTEAPSQPTEEEYEVDRKELFSDDVTESGEEDETSKRSVNTDGQEEDEQSDSSYSRHKKKNSKREKKKARKLRKRAKKASKSSRRAKEESAASPSYG